VEKINVDLSVDQVVNRIVCWIHVGFGGHNVVWKRKLANGGD
jgi:hypothetical protein